METQSASGGSLPPWNNPHLFTEVGLREAQEYFFQTHASNSRLIAEGRSAQGFTKGRLRRKLNKEMGEDFKMYTGSSIGDAKNSAESKGIRGQLNEILESVFIRLAPNQTINSPIHEDLTILGHPLGALEVVFDMACFYTTLQGRYASLASDRRKVLKSVLDEELFKWVWRMFYALVMSDPAKPTDFDAKVSASGVFAVPMEKQQFNTIQKIVDIGLFLLGSPFTQSHLRYPLCFYYVNFLRQIQFRTLPKLDRHKLDAIFTDLRKQKKGNAIEEVLTAVDFLMNSKGSSMHSFDDVLGDEDSIAANFVPGSELEFIEGRQDFTAKRFSESMAKYVPKVSRSETDDAGGSMMPLLILMRTLPFSVSERILEALPGPLLSMVSNRLAYGGDDDVNKTLLDLTAQMVGKRQKRGETYTIASTVKGGTRTVRGELSPAAGGKLHKPPEEGGAAPAQAPDAEQPLQQPKAAGSAAPAQAPNAEQPLQQPKAAVQAEAGAAGKIIGERLILSWRAQDGGLQVTTIAPAEIIGLVGLEMRFLAPWVLFAVKTGQVIRIPPDKLNKEVLERILKTMLKGITNPPAARLSAEERQQVYLGVKGQPSNRILLELVEKYKIGATAADRAGAHSHTIASLLEKLGDQFTSFINSPKQDEHRQLGSQLSQQEMQTVAVLNRVARA